MRVCYCFLVLLLCTFWELFAFFFFNILLFTDQKKKKLNTVDLISHRWIGKAYVHDILL